MVNDLELEYRKTVPIKLGASFLPDGFPLKDMRTIPFRSLLRLKLLPPLPNFYSVDQELGGIDDHEMFGNDIYGDCVKAMMAHGILRFEKFEQGKRIAITTDEVVKEYLRETGGKDTGLYMLLALKDWRSHGLTFGDKNYKIHAFASVDMQDLTQVRYCIYLLRNINVAMQVFQTDVDQFRAGETWHLTGKNGNFLGGHGIYGYLFNIGNTPQQITLSDSYRRVNLVSPISTTYLDIPKPTTSITYADDILEVMTWGVRQQMTTEFWKARVLEAYCVIDQKNPWQGDNSPLDMELCESQLKEITGNPTVDGCFVCKFVKGQLRRLHA